jgi:hypothetical protein
LQKAKKYNFGVIFFLVPERRAGTFPKALGKGLSGGESCSFSRAVLYAKNNYKFSQEQVKHLFLASDPFRLSLSGLNFLRP